MIAPRNPPSGASRLEPLHRRDRLAGAHAAGTVPPRFTVLHPAGTASTAGGVAASTHAGPKGASRRRNRLVRQEHYGQAHRGCARPTEHSRRLGDSEWTLASAAAGPAISAGPTPRGDRNRYRWSGPDGPTGPSRGARYRRRHGSWRGEHLETMGDLDTIQREKSQLLRGLRSGGVAVLNGDDPRVRAMASLAPGRS